MGKKFGWENGNPSGVTSLALEYLQLSVVFILRFQTSDMATVQQIFYKNSSDDFWNDIFARPIVKYGVSIFTLWTLLCLIPFFWISMNFIRAKHYQTMVSYGEALMCFCGIYVMIGIIIFCVPRLLLGPLPEMVCWYQKFFNQSAPITTMLVFDAYYLARVSSTYFYCKKLANTVLYLVLLRGGFQGSNHLR